MARLLLRCGTPFALAAAAATNSFSPASAAAAAEPTTDRVSGSATSLTERSDLVDATQALQAALLRTPPLAGERLRAVRRRTEQDIARCEKEAKTDAVADLRLFVAFLHARDGQFEDALETYTRMAKEQPFDSRPYALAAILCYLIGQEAEAKKWLASYRRLVPMGAAPSSLLVLINELIVAAALGGASHAFDWPNNSTILRAACEELDSGLVAMLADKKLPMVEKLQIRMVRLLLHIKVRMLLMKKKKNGV